MSSGDPLVDEEKQRQAALDQLVNSLNGNGKLLMAQDKPVGSGDPLVDGEEEARKARDKLIDDLVKGNQLIAQDSINAEAVEAGLRAMNDYANVDVAHDQLIAQDSINAEEVEAQLRAMNDYAAVGGVAQNTLEADHFLADESLIHQNAKAVGPATTDLTQMFGGAFLLVAVIALLAVGNRRRKQSKAPKYEECEYQLYM